MGMRFTEAYSSVMLPPIRKATLLTDGDLDTLRAEELLAATVAAGNLLVVLALLLETLGGGLAATGSRDGGCESGHGGDEDGGELHVECGEVVVGGRVCWLWDWVIVENVLGVEGEREREKKRT